jgi:uncharacterized protein YcsI (UPF0317 family)
MIASPSFQDGRSLRQAAREGRYTAPTSGQAMEYVQANLVVVPEQAAFDFLLFCQRNPKPCPLLEVVEAGSVEAARLAPGSDLRRDLPRYRVFRDGRLAEERTDVSELWRDDFVSFLIGCSFSFDRRLIEAGLEVRNVALGRNVSMYRTHIPCRRAGRFEGPLVVSMRPFTPDQAIRASVVTAELPQVHGAPIHMGNPAAIGIQDLSCPEYGDPVPVREGELPVFWACGVTPQEVLLRARLPLAITHAPGHMFVTDLRESELKEFAERVA